jgi:hypothetical protein
MGSPRVVSGGPLAENVFKCQLKPLDLSGPDYQGVAFTPDQGARLAAVFPAGVCDWSKPGVGQTDAVPTTFARGPGGEPLPPAPIAQFPPNLAARMVPGILNLRSLLGVATVVVSADKADLPTWKISELRLQGVPAVATAVSSDGLTWVATFNKRDLQSLPAGNAVNLILTGNLTGEDLATPFSAPVVVNVVK